MKIAVSSTGETLESEVDQRFGRCPFFLLVTMDGDKTSFEAIKNPHAEQQGRAGLASAQLVADKGAEAVITGNVGPRAFDVFGQFGIGIFSASGKVKDALKEFNEGKLRKIERPGAMGV